MDQFFLIFNTLDILCSIDSKFCTKKYHLKTIHQSLQTKGYIFCVKNLNKSIPKYQTYPNQEKIDAFGQEKYFYHNPAHNVGCPVQNTLNKYIYIYMYICK